MARFEARKRLLVAAALTSAAALGAIAMVSGRQRGDGAVAPTALMSFPEYKAMCLSACKYDHAKDTHAKLEVMAKCEPGELSRYYIAYKQDCTSNPHDCNIESMGCGGEYRADMLSR